MDGSEGVMVVATKLWSPGEVITCLRNQTAPLTEEEARQLSADGLDFSVQKSSR